MKKLIKILPVLLLANYITAQHVTNDVGFFVGRASIQTDYGERGNFQSEWSNANLSLSLVHYAHFFNSQLRWNDRDDFFNHVAVKSELNYMTSAKLEHFGIYTEGDTDLARFLNAMKGELSVLNFGLQVEYYLKSLYDFIYPYSDMRWNPYIGFGVRFAYYENGLSSELGDWTQDITVLPVKYRTPGALAIGNGTAWAFTGSIGTRYKFNAKIDFAAQLSGQVFLSDSVDGLQADVPENVNNEWLVQLQVGIIYHLNFNEPLRLF